LEGDRISKKHGKVAKNCTTIDVLLQQNCKEEDITTKGLQTKAQLPVSLHPPTPTQVAGG